MRKRMLFAAALLVASAGEVRGQSTFEFYGCDALVRSCHQASFKVGLPTGGLDPQVPVSVTLKNTFYEKGGFFETGMGGGWSFYLGDVDFEPFDDFFHGSNACYVYMIPTPQFNSCLGNDILKRDFFTHTIPYDPKSVWVNLVYESDPVVHTFELKLVPEPSTYALMTAGLLALGVVARRRRLR